LKLSKSLYTRGLQCQKSLWLKKHKKEVLTPPNSSAQAIFENGNVVGDLACKLFPNGVEIPFENTTFQDKITLTQDYINQGYENIYEATFEFDGILIMIDILNIKDNRVILNEVKSSTDVKDVYLHDASIQYYVLNGLGYDVKLENENGFVTLLLLDLGAYSQKYGSRKSVKKNLTIPFWLNERAEKLNINFSKTLQDALMEKVLKNSRN
jgi:hypothetical protein